MHTLQIWRRECSYIIKESGAVPWRLGRRPTWGGTRVWRVWQRQDGPLPGLRLGGFVGIFCLLPLHQQVHLYSCIPGMCLRWTLAGRPRCGWFCGAPSMTCPTLFGILMGLTGHVLFLTLFHKNQLFNITTHYDFAPTCLNHTTSNKLRMPVVTCVRTPLRTVWQITYDAGIFLGSVCLRWNIL